MSPAEESPKAIPLRVGTVIPAASFVTFVFGAIWWAASITGRLEVFEEQLHGIASNVETIANGTWTDAEHTVWVGAANLRWASWQRELEVALDDLGVDLEASEIPKFELPSISDVFHD